MQGERAKKDVCVCVATVVEATSAGGALVVAYQVYVRGVYYVRYAQNYQHRTVLWAHGKYSHSMSGPTHFLSWPFVFVCE